MMHERVVRRHLRASARRAAEALDGLRATLSSFRDAEIRRHIDRLDASLEILSRMGASKIPTGTGGDDEDDDALIGPAQYIRPEVDHDFSR